MTQSSTLELKPLRWRESVSLFLIISFIVNLIFVSLLAIGDGLSPELLYSVFVGPTLEAGFMANYIATMVGISGILVALNIAVLLPYLGKQAGSRNAATMSNKLVRRVAGGSVGLVALSTPLTISAITHDFRQDHAYASTLIILVVLPVALAFLVGRLMSYSLSEQEAQRGKVAKQLDRHYIRRRAENLKYAGRNWSSRVAWLAFVYSISVGVTMTLSGPDANGWQLFWIIVISFGVPGVVFIVESEALKAWGLETFGLRFVYGVILFVVLLACLANSSTAYQRGGVALMALGSGLCLLPQWRALPRAQAVAALKKKREKLQKEQEKRRESVNELTKSVDALSGD